VEAAWISACELCTLPLEHRTPGEVYRGRAGAGWRPLDGIRESPLGLPAHGPGRGSYVCRAVEHLRHGTRAGEDALEPREQFQTEAASEAERELLCGMTDVGDTIGYEFRSFGQ
jgi:hypothetical protein